MLLFEKVSSLPQATQDASDKASNVVYVNTKLHEMNRKYSQRENHSERSVNPLPSLYLPKIHTHTCTHTHPDFRALKGSSEPEIH